MAESWRPFKGPQAEFCARGEYEVLFGGTKGPGKTDCLIMEATRHVDNPKYQGLILRRTFPRLQEIIDRCWLWYPTIGGEYRATEHRWYFPSKARITLGHCQNEEDKRNYHGKEFHFIGFDELTEFTETQYLFILANVRRTQQELGLRIRATTNPGGVGHVWVKKRFIDTCRPVESKTYTNEDGEERSMGVPVVYFDPESMTSRCFVPATVFDNLYIMRHDPGYVNRLKGLPPAERKRLLDGIWDVYDDQAFPELSKKVHSCDPFPVPPEWEKFMSLDWGYAKPFSIDWYAIDFDGIMYRYREWYGCKPGETNVGLRMTPIDVARGIIEREREKIRFRVADPACWSQVPRRDQTLGPSIIEEMGKEGLFFMKADNNRLLGKMQVHERLKLEQVTNDEGEIISEHPRFLAFNNQDFFWQTMTELQIDVKNPEDVETDNQADHQYDSLRYGCMARPIIPKRQNVMPANTFMAERNRYLKAKNYAKRHGTSLSAAYARMSGKR